MHQNDIINEYITIDEKINFKKNESLSFINNKLISKKLWDKVPYSESPFIEDAPTYCKLIYHANKIIYLTKGFLKKGTLYIN